MWLPNRIMTLKVSCVLAAAVYVWIAGMPTPAMPAEPRSVTRPNFLIILADDLCYHSIGCYGNPDVNTPHLDELSRQGMRFTHAYTSTAMCAPSRAQLLTGLFPMRNGAYPNHSKINPGVKSLPVFLKDLGYRVGINGKKHFKPAASFPFERVATTQFNAPAIREFVARDAGQPFCLVVASHNPHVPWTTGDPEHFEPSTLKLPEDLVDTPQTRSALARYYAEVADLDRQVGECLKIVDDTGNRENTLVIVTSEQGYQFPGGKWTCYENGLRVALIVRWPGVISPATTSDAWVHYVDVVPTLIDAAGGSLDQDVDGRSFLAVLQGRSKAHRNEIYGVHTQAGAIGAPPSGYPIRSIRIGKHKFIWNLNHNVTFSCALTKNDKEQYWQSWLEKAKTDNAAAGLVARYLKRPVEELYDLQADPLELNNLASDPAYVETVDRLRTQLQTWMRQQGDQGMQSELAVKKSSR